MIINMMHSTSVQLFQKHLENQTTCSCTLDLERSEAWFPKWPLENISFCHMSTYGVGFLFVFSSHLTRMSPAQRPGTTGGWLTVDCEVHPAAVVEGVVLLLQHQDPALIPALVLRAHWINLEGGLPMQRGSTWRQRGQKKHLKQI